MSNLADLDNGLSVEFHKLEEQAVANLNDLLAAGSGDKMQMAVSRVALGILGVVQRRRSLELSRDKLYFTMARTIAKDPVELARYIAATSPSSPFAKLVPPTEPVVET